MGSVTMGEDGISIIKPPLKRSTIATRTLSYDTYEYYHQTAEKYTMADLLRSDGNEV